MIFDLSAKLALKASLVAGLIARLTIAAIMTLIKSPLNYVENYPKTLFALDTSVIYTGLRERNLPAAKLSRKL